MTKIYQVEYKLKSEIPKSVINECINQLKINTKHYSKKQCSFIKKRLINRSLPILQLDTTNVDKWEDNIYKRSIDVYFYIV